ncbi:hypothetical protein JVT61DRAFT_6760 [Boletus reticuloceps]|uniref:Uncharacterized protein n=1 Tax=Boletus reticuloceps TaxID=495285 RepID=A0A8I3A662_9AGAM|nr:hypothetical protein JVT61DRAFT_6760 [Boletus reticuloceps]
MDVKYVNDKRLKIFLEIVRHHLSHASMTPPESSYETLTTQECAFSMLEALKLRRHLMFQLKWHPQ